LCLGLHLVSLTPWSNDYQKMLIEKAAQEAPNLSKYPSLKYPNADYKQILDKYPQGKALLFGYGSLINAQSEARTISAKAVHSMQPAIAFGLKRLFNYAAKKTVKNSDLPAKESSLLNTVPMTQLSQMINGVLITVGKEDLERLVQRETGYDLVPILVTLWDDVLAENPSAKIQIAYAFIASDELRQGVRYTHNGYDPDERYLRLVEKGAAAYGEKFLDYFNATTFLSDGTTSIEQWNRKTKK
jgi:hypothetical protein